VFVRIKNVSPNNPNQKFSILCAEQIAVPDVGSKKQYAFAGVAFPSFDCFFTRNFRSLNVLYEPQSLFVKLVVFQHKLSLLEDPVASATIVFEDEKVFVFLFLFLGLFNLFCKSILFRGILSILGVTRILCNSLRRFLISCRKESLIHRESCPNLLWRISAMW
jgi:hypothetical protein